jgi:LacI family transcriptional regulator
MPATSDEQANRATLNDVAREAGVSLATVDRVLNKRPGVHARTVGRVTDAVQRLNYRPDPAAARLARQRLHRVCFMLPSGSNSFVAMLREQIAENRPWMEDHRVAAQTVEVDVFEPEQLAHRLLAIGSRCDTAVVMALDHPLVRAAIDELTAQGIGVITLVSDVPSSRRHRYVGIDNVAAGRTAGTLIGRFVGGRRGEVGVIVGSLSLRDHAERSFGFNQVMAAEYPGLVVLSPIEGKDDSRRTEALGGDLLAAHPALAAIYSVGAGNRGIAAALQASGRAKQVVFVGHELTPFARRDLLSGTMDAVLNQDAGHEVRSALRLALSRLTQEPVHADQERIRIDIYLKDNLP